MSFSGQDDGLAGLANARGAGESKLLDAHRQVQPLVETGRWPGAGTVRRVVALFLGVVILLGWVLTLINR